MTGPRRLTVGTSERTEAPSDARMGIVTAVTSRGIDVAVAGGAVEGIAHLSSYNPAVGDPVYVTRYQDSWMVHGRPVGPGTATDSASPGSGLGATLVDGMALSGGGGVMATSVGAVVTVPRYSVTYFHPPGHWVELQWRYSWFSTVAGDVLQVQLLESLAAYAVQIEHVQPSGGVGNWASQAVLIPPALGDSARTFTMRLQRLAGTGTSRIDDAGARRGALLVFDVGDKSIIRTV